MQNEHAYLEQIYQAAKQFWQDYRSMHKPEFNSEADLARAIMDYEYVMKEATRTNTETILETLRVSEPNWIDVVRCLDFLSEQETLPELEVRHQIVTLGLKASDVRVRDAVMSAVDQWQDCDCLDLLEQHHDPEGWLDLYRTTLVQQLKEIQSHAEEVPSCPTTQ